MSSDTPLDDAWKAAEAALPEGWRLDGLQRGSLVDGWFAIALSKSGEEWTDSGEDYATTPAAALLALAEKLTRA